LRAAETGTEAESSNRVYQIDEGELFDVDWLLPFVRAVREMSGRVRAVGVVADHRMVSAEGVWGLWSAMGRRVCVKPGVTRIRVV
jgi:hypothetical protein